MSKWPKITLKSLSGRLVLVPPTQEDDTKVAALRSDPDTLKYTPFLPKSMTVDQARAYREKDEKNDAAWPFHVYLTSGFSSEPFRFVGLCNIKFISSVDRRGDIGIMISSQVHRTGIATEVLHVLLSHAFEYPELQLRRVDFVTGTHNVRMRGWFESFGVPEDNRPLIDRISGEDMVDALGYRILATEWPDLKARLEKWLNARIPPSSGINSS